MADLHVAGRPVLVCPRSTGVAQVPSTEDVCAACKLPVWVSRVAVDLVASGTAVAVCEACAAAVEATTGRSVALVWHPAFPLPRESDSVWRVRVARLLRLERAEGGR